MSYDYSVWEALEAGSDSMRVKTSNRQRNFYAQVHQAEKTFSSYLATAENETDLVLRVANVEAAMREAGVEDPQSVLEALAARLASDDTEDDSDSDTDDDEDVPDFVDTDKDDDHERDEKKESARHLDPANPGGPQWGNSGGEQAVHSPQGVGTVFPTSPGFAADNPGQDFRGQTFNSPNVPGGHANTYQPTQDAAQAEVEKALVNPNAPAGRHRAASKLPFKARTAAPSFTGPAAEPVEPMGADHDENAASWSAYPEAQQHTRQPVDQY